MKEKMIKKKLLVQDGWQWFVLKTASTAELQALKCETQQSYFKRKQLEFPEDWRFSDESDKKSRPLLALFSWIFQVEKIVYSTHLIQAVTLCTLLYFNKSKCIATFQLT